MLSSPHQQKNMDKLKGIVVVALGILSAFICVSAFGLIDLGAAAHPVGRKMKAILYMDKPLWSKCDASVTAALEYRLNENDIWSSWIDLDSTLDAKCAVNAQYWNRSVRRYLVKDLSSAFGSKSNLTEVLKNKRGFQQILRLTHRLDGGDADSVQFKINVLRRSVELQKTISLDPYFLPKISPSEE